MAFPKIFFCSSSHPRHQRSVLREIVASGNIWLIKPNVDELSQVLGEQVKDTAGSVAKAGRKLFDKVEIVLISRGRKGAIVVTKKGAWHGRCAGRRKVLSTVGCGDYLLAGFLKGLEDSSNTAVALRTAIKAATAKAWGWTETTPWPKVQRQIQVQLRRI